MYSGCAVRVVRTKSAATRYHSIHLIFSIISWNSLRWFCRPRFHRMSQIQCRRLLGGGSSLAPRFVRTVARLPIFRINKKYSDGPRDGVNPSNSPDSPCAINRQEVRKNCYRNTEKRIRIKYGSLYSFRYFQGIFEYGDGALFVVAYSDMASIPTHVWRNLVLMVSMDMTCSFFENLFNDLIFAWHSES